MAIAALLTASCRPVIASVSPTTGPPKARAAWPAQRELKRSHTVQKREAAQRPAREECRDYQPSAEHLHAGNDWVHSIYHPKDDYDNEAPGKAPNRRLHTICSEWPKNFRQGAAAVAKPSGKYSGGTRRLGYRKGDDEILFDGGKKVNKNINQLSHDSPFYNPNGSQFVAPEQPRVMGRKSYEVRTAYAPQIMAHQGWVRNT